MWPSIYRTRLWLRELQREHPIVGAVTFTVNAAVNLAVVALVCAFTYYLLLAVIPR